MQAKQELVKQKHIVQVEVTAEIRYGYRLKVSVADLGLYINGWTIRLLDPSKGWWLQPPAVKVGARWIKYAEFDTGMDLWQEIEAECLKVKDEYERNSITEIPALEELDFGD